MKKVILVFLFNFFVLNIFAVTHSVNTSTFVDVYNNQTQNGDTLLLDAGNYATAVAFPSGKSITLKANPSALSQPVMTFQLVAPTGPNGSLTCDSLIIDRGGDYFFNSAAAYDMLSWKFVNCTIKNISKALINTTNKSGNIASFLIDRCVITSCGTSKTSFIFVSQTVDVFTVINSTIYNYVGGDFFKPNNAATTKNISVSFINNTMYKCIWDNGYGWVSVAYIYPVGNTYVFRNNIFDSGANTDPVANKPLLVYRGNGTVTEENNIKINYQGNNNTTTNATNLTLNSGSLAGYATIPYTDVSTADFSIASSTPFASAGVGRAPVGNPFLIKFIGQAATITTQSFPANAGLVLPSSLQVNQGDSVTVSATRKFGYQFKHWKDQSNNIVSTSAAYRFKLESNTVLIAVFDPVTTYSVGATANGSPWGKIILTPAPTDGKYEAGTEVIATAVSNTIANFLNWENQSTNPTRSFIVNADQNLVALFDEVPFITGWNFVDGVRINRPGDFYSETSNVGSISAFEHNGTAVQWTTSSGFNPSYPNIRLWTNQADFNAGNVRYLKTDFSTQGWKNIQVKSMVAGDWQAYAVYKLQYSIDNGTSFHDVPGASVNIESSTGGYKSTWSDLNATLLADANNLARVHVRWIADKTSNKLDKTGNGNDVEGTSFTNIYILAEKEVINDNDAPVLVSAVPANNSNTATINGSVVLTFNERVKSGTGNMTLGGANISAIYGSKTATFNYEKLNYNTDYTFSIPAGAITDMSGNAFAGITITFRTASRTEPVKKLYDAVVAADGSGDYLTLISALSAAPAGRQSPWVIFVKNGTYQGHHVIPSSKPFLHIIGQSRNGVVIKDNLNANNGGIAERSTMVVQSSDCYFENLLIENSHGYEQQTGPMAEALTTEMDRFAMKNVYIRSYQDTWKTPNGNARHYVLNSRIEGAVDFIYGSGEIFFDRDTLTVTKAGSYIVAPAHGAECQWGYVFKDNVINQNTDKVSGNINSVFGRPWQNAPKAVFLNSKLLTGINPEGWNAWYTAPSVFADYGTVDVNNNPIDLSQRRSVYPVAGSNVVVKNSLTDQEAATYTYENVVLRSGDTWDPRLIAEAPAQPVNLQLQGNVLTWDETAYTRLYVISRDKVVIGFSLVNQYTDATAVSGTPYSYSVQAASEYGALSSASQPLQTLPVTGLSLKATNANQSVKIDFSTLSEQGTSHFVIEKTQDNKSFEGISNIKAQGDSYQKNFYSYTDKNPNIGTTIYRVKSVDFNGEFSYSNLVAVNFGLDASVSVFPNPSSDVVKLQTEFKNYTVKICDLSGKLLIRKEVEGEFCELSVAGFNAGVYILEVTSSISKFQTRFIKQ